jgi:hypothetical protein
MPFSHAHNIGERDEENILKLEPTLFHMKRNVSAKN